jgi:phosphoglycolate phosphatase-like HAD superfamily hydrolase
MTPPETRDSTEAMAFQLVLQKLEDIEQVLHQMAPLLGQIVAHLRTQAQTPDVPVARFAQLYADVREAEVSPAPAPPPPVLLTSQHPVAKWRWWKREVPHAEQ